MTVKKAIVNYIDVGLIGTFVRFKKKPGGEEGYVYLEYVALDENPRLFDLFRGRPRIIEYPRPIHRDHIYRLDTDISMKGIVDEQIFIYTNERNSLVRNKLEAKHLEMIDRLKERVKTLEMNVSTKDTELRTAQSGVKKAISSINEMKKEPSRDRDLMSPLSGLRSRYVSGIGTGGMFDVEDE